MFTFTLAMALLLVWAFARVRLAAFAQKTMRSLDLEYQRRAPVAVDQSDRSLQ